MYITWWIVVGLIAGWLTGKRMSGFGFGLMDIFMGITGAVAAGYVMRSDGFSGLGGMVYTTLVAILGAVVLTALVASARGRRRYA